MSTVIWAVIACGIIAVLYGVVTASRVMAADSGTARMQEIAQAIQEGASAYLRRQYTTIAIVGVVVLAVIGGIAVSVPAAWLKADGLNTGWTRA